MKRPQVKRAADGSYSVEIAPKSFLRWHVEPRREGLVMIINVDAPTLTNYARVRECDDIIELPIRDLPQ